MIPDTLLGLVLFAAAFGPGYAFVRVQEQHEPRPERSPLLEAVELVVVGAVTTSAVAIVVFTISVESGLLDPEQFAADAIAYSLSNPWSGFLPIFAILVISPLFAHLIAWLMFRDEEPSIRPGSAWFRVLGRRKQDAAAFVTVDLRDGSAAFGQLSTYTVDPELDNREVILYAPIKVRRPAVDEPGSWMSTTDEFLILQARDISSIGVKYVDRPPGSGTPEAELAGLAPPKCPETATAPRARQK